MKKILSLALALAMSAMAFAGCAKTNQPTQTQDSQTAPQAEEQVVEGVDIRIGGLKGPTTMGLVSLLDKSEKGETVNNYIFTMAASADEVTPKLVQGELDMAAVPANLASVIYNNTQGKVKLLAVNTLGVIYIVNQGEGVSSVEDLKGKTIYATGKGSTPEYAMRYILSQNGVDPDKDVTFEWKSEPTEIVAILKENTEAIAMLPQPFVTVAQTQIEGLKIAINLNEEWNKLNNGSLFITGVLVVRDEFAQQHPQQVAAFLEEYEASTQFINTNVEEGAQLVEKYNIVKAPIAQKAIPYCNITFISGEDMKLAMNGYLQVLFDQNAKSVGSAMPNDDFYYEVK